MTKPQEMAEKPKFEKRHCLTCGKEFQAKRKWHEYCSSQCRLIGWRKSNTDPAKVASLEKRIAKIEKHLGVVSSHPLTGAD